MESAPFFADLADGPADGRAFWLQTQDAVRIRVGLWNSDAPKGTVLLFPGRTEYIEKYGRAAQDLAMRGYATLAVDWRGQGLADRLIDNPLVGHVERFTDYQHDVSAALQAAKALNLPRPFHLIGHSMGGCIGLRAVMDGLDVQSCVFSAPMWGIILPLIKRPAAWAIGWGSTRVGLGHMIAPGTKQKAYVQAEPFANNTLTTDAEMFGFMQKHLLAQPGLALGGPSVHWVHEALREMRLLAARPSPDVPCLTFLGSNERIVDPARIEQRMAAWPKGVLHRIHGAEHEVMMETPAIRNRVFDMSTAHFAGALSSPESARSA